ncbi:MAG: hypothetical protein GY749_46240 [Desulfobacteraceae bacterium]|nr:hypothetical protein [Desulfobacteraceae bacterium]
MYRIPPEEREDILTSTGEGVIKDVKTYEGRRGAKFSTWVWQIYRNKINDYFREKKTYSIKVISKNKYTRFHVSESMKYPCSKKQILRLISYVDTVKILNRILYLVSHKFYKKYRRSSLILQ